MLERIYIDNYKCLVNFEYRPGALQLLLGGNGSGKSMVFEVLASLRSFIVDRTAVGQLFPDSSLTRWQTSNEQTFELEVSGNGGKYQYRLAVGHLESGRIEVSAEELSFNGKRLFLAELIELEPDDQFGPAFVVWSGDEAGFSADAERSGLPLLVNRTEIRWFREWLSRLYRVQINPYTMSSESKEEQVHPRDDLSNYASWYRHLSQERPSVTFDLFGYLKPIIGGFKALFLSKEGETTRVLKAEVLDGAGRSVKYSFGELSEGQRVLIGLYTLLALMKETSILLCIDEPDNFVALPELQPWLMELQDLVEERGSQVLVISHHPELINYLVPRGAVRFSRVPEGPVRVAPFAPTSDEPLSAAEIIARGWEDE